MVKRERPGGNERSSEELKVPFLLFVCLGLEAELHSSANIHLSQSRNEELEDIRDFVPRLCLITFFCVLVFSSLSLSLLLLMVYRRRQSEESGSSCLIVAQEEDASSLFQF